MNIAPVAYVGLTHKAGSSMLFPFPEIIPEVEFFPQLEIRSGVWSNLPNRRTRLSAVVIRGGRPIMTDVQEIQSEDSFPTSHTLLQSMVHGSPNAWSRLLSLYCERLEAKCRCLGLQANDATAVVEDVFTQLWITRDQFQIRRQRGAFRSWLAKCTLNRVRDLLREWKRHGRGKGDSPGSDLLAQIPDLELITEDDFLVTRSELLGTILTILETDPEIGPRNYQIFRRRVMDDCDATTVGEEFGLKPGNVRTICSRVLSRIRELLKEGHESE